MSFKQFRDAIRNRDFEYLDTTVGTTLYTSGLFVAAAMNEPEGLAYFLRAGQNVNQREAEVGNTPLMGAAQVGAREAVRFLLANGADPLQANLRGETALDKAEAEKQHTVVRAFREIGLEPSLPYLLENDYPAFQARVRSPTVSLRDRWGRSALPELLRRKKDALVKELLQDHDEINTPGKEGLTCLHIAILRKNAALVRYLLENGADPNCVGEAFFDATPLILAVNEKALSLLPILVAFGAEVNLPDVYGATPLIHAIRERAPKLVAFLLDNGADPRLGRSHLGQDEGADTWQTAAKEGNQAIIKMLASYSHVDH